MSTLLHTTFTIILIIPLLNASQTFQSSINEYSNTIISCDDTSDCQIICNQPNACKNTKINCPIGHSCDITCSATKACDNTLIIATHSSSLSIHDCSTGSFTCKGLSIYLPPNNNGIPRATINGADDGLSEGAGYNNTLDGEDIIPINFYAIYGWNDINIINYSGTYKYHKGIMHCTIGYSSTCPFNPNAWECENTNHICSTHDHEKYPTTSQFIPPEDYILNKSGKYVHTSSVSPLWYIANILIISIMTLILIFIICVIRAYRIEKQLVSKCNAADNELLKLQKLYDDKSTISPTPIPSTNININDIKTTSLELKSTQTLNKTITDENVAVEILSTPQSMVSVDTINTNDIIDIEFDKSESTNNSGIGHSVIMPNDEWSKQMNNNNDGIPMKKYVLKLSDIPTPNYSDKISGANSMANTMTMTKTTMSLQSMIIPKISQKSENSSLYVMFHEMNDDKTEELDGSVSIITDNNNELECKKQSIGNIKYEYDSIFVREKLSVLKDENEDECD